MINMNGPNAICEKVRLEFTSVHNFHSLHDAPSTFNKARKEFEWKKYEFIYYSLVPQNVNRSSAIVDMYVRADEDDLDDVNVNELCLTFAKGKILPEWKDLTEVRLSRTAVTALFDEGSPAEE